MESFGFSHFLAQADAVGLFVLFSLLAMSLASWTLILVKLVQLRSAAQAHQMFLAGYQSLLMPAGLHAWLREAAPAGACARVAAAGLEAASRWARRSERRLIDGGDGGEFVGGGLAQAVSREQGRMESGLAVLAAVGSTSPFVGLLGTVWGIFHALIAIGVSGQGTLDKVAGPVGEALVMTALGLVVAIPAVLAYNAFVRATQRAAGELDDFAHELMSFMTTGVHAESQPWRDATAAQPALAGSH